MSAGEALVAARWHAAVLDPAVAAELEAVYAYVAAAVESRGPACWASGRCCSFERAGHRLYVTGLEAAYAMSRTAGAVTAATLSAALARGGCPLQAANLCGAHAMRPLGCRVYFCDRSAQEWQRELSEKAIAQVRAVHDRHGVPYRYGEWRQMLALLLESGA